MFNLSVPPIRARTALLLYYLCIISILSLTCLRKTCAISLTSNRLLVGLTASDNAFLVFPCNDSGMPSVDPSAGVDSMCALECINPACTNYYTAPFVTRPLLDAEHLAFGVSDANSPALLYANPYGVTLAIGPGLWDSIKYYISFRRSSVALGPISLGNSLALNLNGTWLSAFVENVGNGTFQAVLETCEDILCLNWSERIVSRWDSGLLLPSAPIFVKSDLYGRTIVGFQAFSHFGVWFEIWRCEMAENCTLMSNTTLTNAATSIRVAPDIQPSNYAVVLLGGTTATMFHYISGYSDTIFPDPVPITPTPIPATPTEANPTNSSPSLLQPDSNTATETPRDQNSTQPSTLTPLNPSNSTSAPVSSNDSAPTLPSLSAPSAPSSSAPIPSIDSYWYTSYFHPLITSIPTRMGFQVGLDILDNLPYFVVSSLRQSTEYRVTRGHCATTSCSTQLSLSLLQVLSASGGAGTGVPHVVSVVVGRDLGPTILYISHYPGGLMHRTGYTAQTNYSTATVDGDITFLDPPAASPPFHKLDIFGIVGITNAILASTIVIVSVVVFVLHFSLHGRDEQARAALWDAASLTTEQEHILAVYYTALKSD